MHIKHMHNTSHIQYHTSYSTFTNQHNTIRIVYIRYIRKVYPRMPCLSRQKLELLSSSNVNSSSSSSSSSNSSSNSSSSSSSYYTSLVQPAAAATAAAAAAAAA